MFRLRELLSRFSVPATLAHHAESLLGEHMTVYQKQFEKAVVWLLKHNLLGQIFTFVHLCLPAPASPLEDSNEDDSDDWGSLVSFAPHSLLPFSSP